MEKSYKASVNDNSSFEFTPEELSGLDISLTSPDNFHLLRKGRSFEAEITQSDFLSRTYSVRINSRNYTIKISNELDQLIEEMGLSLGSAQKVNDIKAPMPGLILEVNVTEGSQVKEGDFLLVLEAMKMENTLTAPRDGVVKSVTIEKGQAVDKNQLLIEME